MRTFAVIAVILGTPAGVVAAQDRPPTWMVRLDSGTAPDSTFAYQTMAPGWHVTSQGNAGILYDPAWRASGNFRLELALFVFPGSAKQEGVGLFFGGEKLERPDQSYLYFLIRPDGHFIVKHRAGSDTHEITKWARAAAVVTPVDKPVKNVLSVEARPDTVSFLINGQRVFQVPRADPRFGDGQAGLRVNHGVNVHVTELTIRWG